MAAQAQPLSTQLISQAENSNRPLVSPTPDQIHTTNTAIPTTTHQNATIYDPAADIIPVQQDDIIRLKIFIPLATLSALFANLVSAFVIKPSMREINDRYYTVVTPDAMFIGLYWALLFSLLVGLAFMIVFTSNQRYRTEQTKQLFVNALGLRYVLALFCFTLWPFFWAAQLMTVAAVILGLIFLLLASINISLYRHFPASFLERPFSFLFVHVPLRLFLLVLWQVDLLQTILIALQWFRIRPEGDWERHHRAHTWIVLGIVVIIGLVNAAITAVSEDIVWAIGSVWLTAGVVRAGSGRTGKLGEEPVLAGTLIALAGLQVVSLAAAIGVRIGRVRRSSSAGAPIRLPDDELESSA